MTDVPSQATPERLTTLLQQAGVLAHGKVVDVAVETSRDTLISRVTRLRLTYDPSGAGRSGGTISKCVMAAVHDLGCLELLD